MQARRATRSAAAAAVVIGCVSAASAQQADSPLKSVMKLMGFATDVAPPADFVQKSRPQTNQDYISVFQPPPEPSKPVLKDNELKALRGDLDSVEKRADAARRDFPPAAKAVAEQQQAKAKTPKPTAASADK